MRTAILRRRKQRVSLGPGAMAWSVPDEQHSVANEYDGDLVLLVRWRRTQTCSERT